MTKFKGKTVLITGGGSGIGKSMGKLVLEKGARLIIWDIDRENLENTRMELETLGEVISYPVDVSKIDEVRKNAGLVKETYGGIDVLINNAGIIVGKFFNEHSTAEIDSTMDINATAPMHITSIFLEDMMKREAAHICNIASSAGFLSNPRMSVYAASKWALLGWSDSLRLEMKQLGKNVNVSTVTPFYINTGMFAGVRSIIPVLDQEKVANKIIKGIEKDRIIISMPWSMRFVRFFQGLFPIWFFDWFVGKVLGVYHTMDHFEGRKDQKVKNYEYERNQPGEGPAGSQGSKRIF
ncbi:SDR family oxidoreductase [Antarcticibacterium flavum]|uniref:SDR family oxidoreductase n=1 Tax=Antarcticibacterium flavum TaxID=2058175 RepID=A0A5B7WZ64_9FLAO|nr:MULTISPECIES: SDR family oxidoreductase [Antarcticibacterium]MCM4158609.1 short-chain dehydrogenase [Antarcticibacterium sp. W02-3]QCY68466.1 SDR family oxidoreductase [Antarcticibacterium flavum]